MRYWAQRIFAMSPTGACAQASALMAAGSLLAALPLRAARAVLRLPLPLRAPRGVLAPLPACGRSCVLALGPAGRCWPARIFAQRTRLVAPALGAAPSGADFFRQAKDSVATVSTLATWSPADVPRQHAIALRKSPELR